MDVSSLETVWHRRVCSVHIPKEKRRKLDKKAKKGILVGFCNETKVIAFGSPKNRESKFPVTLHSENIQANRQHLVQINKKVALKAMLFLVLPFLMTC